MAARESAQVLAALADVLTGTTRADAAKRHGVAVSSITRAMKRRDMPALRPGRRMPAPPPDVLQYRYADGSPLVPPVTPAA